MSTDRDVTRIVRSWLEEGATALPDRVLDTVLDQLLATPQRRARWPARRFREMKMPIRIAVVAATVVAVALIGVSFLPRTDDGLGGPGPTASPSPTIRATPSPMPSGSLEPGVYSWPAGDEVVPVRFSLSVPSGWSNEGWAIARGAGSDVIVSPWTVLYTYRDPCRWMTSVVDPGTTVQGLIDALRQQAGRNSSPVPSTIDGHVGQQIELDVPTDIDPSTCDGNEYRSWVGPGPGVTGKSVAEPSRVGLQPGLHSVITILDVDGTRLLIEASYPAGASSATIAEALAIVDSIKFEP